MKILIVKLSSLGDVVQTMPVVADLQRQFPNCQIDWVVEEAFAPLVARVQGVHRVIPIALRRWRKSWLGTQTRAERAAFKIQLTEQIYDAVIDCQGLTKSALVARMAKLALEGVRGSFANKSEACSYEWPVKFLLPNNQPMPVRIHAVARTRLLASKLLGYEDTSLPQVVFKNLTASTADSKKIMFTHGTTRTDNEWPLAHWIVLANTFIACGHPIVLPQSNSHEQSFCEALRNACGNAILILPRMNLSEMLNAMSTCCGVVGVDSGLSHMAVALGLPHVQIFSQDRAWRAGPIDLPHQVAIGGTDTPSANEVIAAWQRVSTC
jgi:heptosyltransferase I